MSLSGHHDITFFNDVVNDLESFNTEVDNYLIFASLKIEPTRMPGLHLLISSLPGSASRTHVESLGKPRNSTCVLEALPGILDTKRHSPSILY